MRLASIIVVLLVTGTGYHQVYSSTRATYSENDTIRLKRATLEPKSRWQTLVLRNSVTNPARKGSEILLPLGINAKTIRINSGDTVLVSGTDYVYVSETNRLRVLNDRVLQAEEPLSITYELPAWRFK